MIKLAKTKETVVWLGIAGGCRREGCDGTTEMAFVKSYELDPRGAIRFSGCGYYRKCRICGNSTLLSADELAQAQAEYAKTPEGRCVKAEFTNPAWNIDG